MRGLETRDPKKDESEQVLIVERQPRPDWFATATNERGEQEWFLRIEMTGAYPRRIGPFTTQRQALLRLDVFLNHALDCFADVADGAEVWVEDALASHYRQGRHQRPAVAQKGR